ncbi:MAG: hypothetical protein MJH08_01595 [Hyphomicrobiales bacterium]|nr:hypothetical protein [Hyphomicrobiales bacterium]
MELLLRHGARINDAVLEPANKHSGFTVAAGEEDPDIVRLLVRYGANLLDFDQSVLAFAAKADLIPQQAVDRKRVHLAQVQRGGRNPQPFWNPFYIEQIRTFDTAYGGIRRAFDIWSTDCLAVPCPSFSFNRLGRTITPLPDGRLVFIAGEHEDSYDRDFCIYNDICVLDENGGVEYFTYPVDKFPPTDFHSATLLDDNILLIGNLGYPEQREAGVTQVLRLDINTWRVSRVATSGDNPGWISEHTADLCNGEIIISGGKRLPDPIDVTAKYALNTRTMRWRVV